MNRNAWLIPWPDAAVRSASIARRWPTRESQTVGAVTVVIVALPAPATARPGPHGGGDPGGRATRVEDEVVGGVGRGHGEERSPDPAVELRRLPLDPVALVERGRTRARGRGRARRSGRGAGRGWPSGRRARPRRRRGDVRRPGRPASSRRSGR